MMEVGDMSLPPAALRLGIALLCLPLTFNDVSAQTAHVAGRVTKKKKHKAPAHGTKRHKPEPAPSPVAEPLPEPVRPERPPPPAPPPPVVEIVENKPAPP